MWTWGNATGFMTDSGDNHSNLPIRVKGLDGQYLEDIVAISAQKEFWLALQSDGTVWSWGRNESGQLGNGTYNNTCFTNAVQVVNAEGSPLTGVTAISTGGYHSMALKEDGTVWCWGKNENGQLGNGLAENAPNPVQVTGLTDVDEVSAGEFHSMIRKTDGTVWTWGRNQYGQLGDNTRNNSLVPVQVKGENGVGYLTGVKKIDAGIGFSMAITADDKLMAWGHNNSYQLGDGTQQSKNAPVYVKDAAGTGVLENVVEVSANYETAMAKTTDGKVWIWGTNRYGEFGNGTSGSTAALLVSAFYTDLPVITVLDTKILYDNIYHEYELLLGRELEVELTLKGEDTQTIVNTVIELYDSENKKVSSYSSGKVIPAGTSTNVVISTFIPSDKDVSFAKVLITDSNTGFVIAEALELTLNSVDLFGNDFTTAWTMGSKTSAAGTINTDSDTDVFEFTAKADGLHVFETYGGTDTFRTICQGHNENFFEKFLYYPFSAECLIRRITLSAIFSLLVLLKCKLTIYVVRPICFCIVGHCSAFCFMSFIFCNLRI